jgi:riboflavin kinase / FMN adenylyltransferase
MSIRHHTMGTFSGPCVMAIGNFDGVHVGHRFLLSEAKAYAKRFGVPLVAATFDPHPREYFDCNFRASRINSVEDNTALLLNSDADGVVTFVFDEHLANMTARSFCEEILIGDFKVKCLFMGEDFCLGANREGNFRFLKEFGSSRGLDVVMVDTFVSEGSTVSSTRIRNLLGSGKIREAEFLMGKAVAG